MEKTIEYIEENVFLFMALPEIRILIPSGAGAPGFAGIVECLKERAGIKIIAGDINPKAYGSSLADKFFVNYPSDNAQYLDAVSKKIKEESIDLILPITTKELLPLSLNKERISQLGAKLIISDPPAIEVANDKGATWNYAESIGINIPQGAVVKNIEEWENAVTEILNTGKNACFKPIFGNGMRGFGIVENNRIVDFWNEKSGILPLNKQEWFERLKLGWAQPLLVSEFLPGKEYSVDLIIHQTKVKRIAIRTRDKMIGGISVQGTFIEHQEIEEMTVKLVEGIGLEGPVGVQWREDENRIPKLLEINPRIQGTTSASRVAGINIPLETVKISIGEEVDFSRKIQLGSSFSRFWKDISV